MNETTIQELRGKLRGELITPADPTYDAARKVYNGMIDRRPALIARCRDAADVMAGVAFAREHGLLLAVRGGAHNGPGLGTCDGGLVLDLSPMRGVRVDPTNRTVRVAGGAVWGDVDHATHPFGLAVPSGFISTTGVGGLTLGGGRRLPHAPLRPHHRQPPRGGRGPGRRSSRHRQPAGARRSLLGRARRWRELRRRDIVPVPRQSGRHRLRRADLLAAQQGTGGPPLLAGLHPEGAGGSERLVRLRHRAPGADVPPGAPPPEDVRDRVVLHGRRRQGRRRLQADPRVLAARDGLCRSHPVPGPPESVRRPVPAGPPVVLEGRLLPRDQRPGHRPAPEARRRAAQPPFHHAPLPDQRRCPPRGTRATPPGASGMPTSRR